VLDKVKFLRKSRNKVAGKTNRCFASGEGSSQIFGVLVRQKNTLVTGFYLSNMSKIA
jgi:hypothetical protein